MSSPGRRRIIAVDFDATISSLSSFKGVGVFGEPITGVADVLKQLSETCDIMIYTCRREHPTIREYLKDHTIPFNTVNYSPVNIEQNLSESKMYADVYIDDRALQFCGIWDDKFLKDVINFKPWWSK